jgi:hypothetical protein
MVSAVIPSMSASVSSSERYGSRTAPRQPPVHPGRHALERQRHLSLQLTLSRADLLLRERVRGQLVELLRDRLLSLRRGLRRRADVHARHSSVGVEALKRVHRVRERELLPNSLKEPRAHPAAEDRVDERHRVPPRIVVRHGRRTEHDVRLGALTLDVAARRRRSARRRHRQRCGIATRNVAPSRLLQCVEQLLVRHVPRACDHHVRRVIRAPVQLLQLAHASADTVSRVPSME